MLVGRWVCWLDPDKTREAYASWQDGGLGACDCAFCKNLRALGDTSLPHEGKSILTALGADFRKPHNMVRVSAGEDGRHLYRCDYYLRGNVVARRLHPSTTATQGGEYVTADFSVECAETPGDLPEPFYGEDWMRLIVRCWVKWVISEEPEGAHHQPG